MIRDFCKITRKRLVDEIAELRKQVAEGKAPAGVTPESVQGIDDVRSIGNIGAHMEADINVIVDVDEGEADVLIKLVEMLFDEWYVAQHQRQQQFAKLAAIAAEKKAQIAEARARSASAVQSQPLDHEDQIEPPGSTTTGVEPPKS